MVEVRPLHLIILLLVHFFFVELFLITALFVFLVLHLIAIAALHGLDANPSISPGQEEKFIFTLLIYALGFVGVLITILLVFFIVLLLITIYALRGLLIVAHEDTTGDYSWSSEC